LPDNYGKLLAKLNIMVKPMPKAKKQPRAHIVILNWNSLKDTLKCLASLSALEYANYKVIVVDNGSKNNEADKLAHKFPNVHVIANTENLGYTGGCNKGIEHALKNSADFVLLLNNDTTVEPNFLAELVDFYQNTADAGMVSPLILYSDKKRIWFAGGQVALGMIRHINKGRPIDEVGLHSTPFLSDYVPGTSLLIGTDLIKKIGKLNDKYFAYYEDLEWCYKAQQLGLLSYVVPSSIIYHKKSGSTSDGGHKRFNKIPAYYIARNGVLYASNLKSFRKMWYLFCQLFIKLPLSLLLVVKPDAWWHYIVGMADGFLNRSGRSSRLDDN
jgi:GT2 family glycosyltransferase